jgi:AraC family ethanolamine operon transcriptional activator
MSTFSEPNGHAEFLGGSPGEILQMSPGRFESRVVAARLSRTLIVRETVNRSVLRRRASRPDSLVLAIPLAVTGDAWVDGRRIADAVPLLYDGADLPEVVTSPGLELLLIGLDRGQFATSAAARGVAGLVDVWSGQRLQFTPETRAELNQFLEACQSILKGGCACPATEQALIDSLVDIVARAPTLEPLPTDAHKALVDQALSLCLADPQVPISLERAAQMLGVSRRHLQKCFIATSGASARQVLRMQRLNEVRLELIAARTKDARISIGDIAAKWGFWHWSRFSSEYRHLFAELPSETLRPWAAR